jgi:hypothetical protein
MDQMNDHGHARTDTPAAGGGTALNTAVGDRELCAWQPVRGIVWVQTRNPNHARRMAKRSDGRLVAYGVAGGYLRTFEFQRPLSWALRLMSRYSAAETTANAALNRAICPPAKRVNRADTSSNGCLPT